MQMRFFDAVYISHQLFVHIFYIITAAWHIICRNIFTLFGTADPAKVQLQCSLERCHLTFHLNKIHRLKIFNTRCQLPDFGIHCTGLVLKHHGIIALTGFCL